MKWLRVFWKFLNREISVVKKQKKVVSKEVKEASKPEQKPPFVKPSEELLHIQVGLDFGTNCSKACYSVIGSSPKIYPIIFNHKLSSFPNFVMPSVVMFDSKKVLVGEQAAAVLEAQRWGRGLRNFKTLLAAKYEEPFRDEVSERMFNEHIKENSFNDKEVNSYIITAAYISYMMHVVRAFLNHKFKSKKINLIFNICIPVDYIEKNHVKTVFENSFALAEAVEKEWRVGGDDFDPLRVALELKDKVKYEEKNPETRIFAIPEAIAEVMAYIKSSKRKTGMHALIDFGSGTTDVSIFYLTRGIEEKSFWYSASAIPYGVFQIEKALVDSLGETQKDDSLRFIFEIINNMNLHREKYRDFLSCTREELNKFFSSRKYTKTWSEAYKHLRKESAWHDVKIFVSGGGSQLPYINELASTPWWPQIQKRYEVEVLAKPDDFDLPANIPFYRMAVAYGLTWPKPMFRGYTLPKDAPDHTPPLLPKKKLPDRDELYPK